MRIPSGSTDKCGVNWHDDTDLTRLFDVLVSSAVVVSLVGNLLVLLVILTS